VWESNPPGAAYETAGHTSALTRRECESRDSRRRNQRGIADRLWLHLVASPSRRAAGIATLISDPERRAQIAEAARGHALRNFDWEAIGEKQRNLLR